MKDELITLPDNTVVPLSRVAAVTEIFHSKFNNDYYTFYVYVDGLNHAREVSFTNDYQKAYDERKYFLNLWKEKIES